MYEVNGNVGISTTQPAISLDVRTGALPQMGIAGTTDYLTFFASDAYGPAIYWDPAKDMRFGKGGASLYNPYGFVEQMRIKSSNGNVGIGTQTPGSPLDVAGDINFSGRVLNQGYPVMQMPAGPLAGNTAVGVDALQNTSVLQVGFNTAVGYAALLGNTTGNWNTAVGSDALSSLTTGTDNTAIGYQAGYSHAGGDSYNIDIGNQGIRGDSDTIRIGTSGMQTRFFASGIYAVTTSQEGAIPVVVDAYGQLGTVSSSRRYKEDIADMGTASHDLMRLRPVTFRYQKAYADGSKPIQFGLIAEEVAEVYPDLVAHSADGQIETVKYQVLDSMLLNEVQRQQAEVRRLEERLAKLETALTSISVGSVPGVR